MVQTTRVFHVIVTIPSTGDLDSVVIPTLNGQIRPGYTSRGNMSLAARKDSSCPRNAPFPSLKKK